VLGTPDAPIWKVPSKDWCKDLRPVSSFNAGISTKHWRRHHASIVDFGGIGDGVTLNTLAFQRAVANLSSFSKNGGVQLNVPPGKWLTGSFNLTSHFTLFLHKDAVILGSQVLEPSNHAYH
jgi:polygalacturonase